MIVEFDTELQKPIGYITTEEAAKKWNVKVGAVRQLVNRNRIRFVKVGRMIFIPEDEEKIDMRKFLSGRKPVDEWLDEVGQYGYRIKRNAIRCKKCGDVIESKFRHDFKWCSCGQCAVDGGHDYMKRCYKTDTSEEAYDDISEWEEVTVE